MLEGFTDKYNKLGLIPHTVENLTSGKKQRGLVTAKFIK